MGADLKHLASAHDHHEVRLAHGREAVCDQDGDAAAGAGVIGRADVTVKEVMFCGGVESGGWLVQDGDQRGGAHKTAGQGQALPLSAGQVLPVWSLGAELGLCARGEGL